MSKQKTSQWVVIAVTVAAVVALVSGCMLFERGDQAKEIRMDQLPTAVRVAAEKETAGCRIIEVEEELKDGKTIYAITYEEEGKEMEIEYAEDGTLLFKGLE